MHFNILGLSLGNHLAFRNVSYRDAYSSCSIRTQQEELRLETQHDLFQSSGYRYGNNYSSPRQSLIPLYSFLETIKAISLFRPSIPQNKIIRELQELSPKEVGVRVCPDSNTKQKKDCDWLLLLLLLPPTLPCIILVLRTQCPQTDRRCL